MSYDMDDALNSIFSSKPVAKYTEEEIDAAKKRQKKHGGSFMDNLIAIKNENSGSKKNVVKDTFATGTSTPNNVSPATAVASTQKESPYKDMEMSVSSDDINKVLAKNAEDINEMIKGMNANLEKDYGVKNEVIPEAGNPNALESFKGIDAIIKEKVFGQDDFIKKLIIAFKRPYVSERDDNDAMNSIFITGPKCTGKHYSLELLVEELSKRKVLKQGGICTMDLSLYPTQAEEKLFLQDLYSALKSDSSVIAFENYEGCHISMLNSITNLVITGEYKLSERYVMQNGQLVSVSNALTGNVVGSLVATGKYFVFISNKTVDKLADSMGAPFVNALGDICTANKLDEAALGQILDMHEKQLVEKCKKQLAFDVTIGDGFKDYVLSQTSKGRELQGVLDTYSETLKALAEFKLENDEIESNAVTLTYKEGAVFAMVGDKEISLSGYLPQEYSGEINKVKEELDRIVGLTEVKDYILSLEEYYGTQKRRQEAGLKAGEVNKHMIFTGNPGTGKTTIARIVSKYLKAIGVLSGGQLVEVSRADLVGRYVGHTAPLVNQVIKSALGGVLFIDEAYSLNRGKDDSFGLEAIDTLVKGIEDNRDNLVVILAGYSQEMGEFLETNSGLKSRFPNIIDFPDYTGEELLKIADITAKSKGYAIDDSVREPLLKFFEMTQLTNAREAGNGRLVRNKIEEAILNQSRRMVAEPDADMSLLVDKDFELS